MATTRPSYAATIAQREPFKHEHLKLSENYIRLFQVQAAPTNTKTDLISLQITQFAIHRRPPYKAISYTWGSGIDSPTILVNGRSFNIHRNLWNLLYHLRLRRETAFLWADRMCIDQGNLAERNFHVQLMGKIYDHATSVIVWLGMPDAERTEVRAMEFVKEIVAVADRSGRTSSLSAVVNGNVSGLLAKMYLAETQFERWRTLWRMCCHNYWTRTWIIQEFLRAPTVEVLCGTASLDWTAFEKLVELIQSPTFTDHEAIIPLFATRPIRLTLRRKAKPVSTLYELLREYHDSKCTERRDKVYGILGLASDCSQDESTGVVRGIRPDYKKHIVDVYLDTIACIEQSLKSSSLVPSAANMVCRTLMLSDQDFLDYIEQTTNTRVSMPSIYIMPSYVGIVRNPTTWSSVSDLKQKLGRIDWGEYIGYEVRSQRPGLGRRSSLRALPSSIPEDMIQNVVNAAEMDPELSCLYNYPSIVGLHIPSQHIALHKEDKRSFDNETLQKPVLFLEQAQNSTDIRIGFACTNARHGDLLLQFEGLDIAVVVRQAGHDTFLVGKALMIRHCHLDHQFPLDNVCQSSPWISSCLRNSNQDALCVQSDALSLAELLARSTT